MKKSILVILLVLLAFVVWSVLAFGKAKKDEGVKQPAQIQKVEPSPAPEDFPEVVLPKPRPYRPTMEDFQREVLDHKGWTMEDVEEMKNKFKPMPAEEGFELPEETATTFCQLHNFGGCCSDMIPHPVDWLHCWGQIGIATFMDPTIHGGIFDCPYPPYPFQPIEVKFLLYSSDTCTVISESRIYSVDYSGGGPYPDSELCSSDKENPLVFSLIRGPNWITVPLDTPACCLNEPFFAVWVFNNSDDFYDTVSCTPKYSNWLCWLTNDITRRLNQQYWNPFGLDSPWYDMIQYDLFWTTVFMRVGGYIPDQNTCPPPVDEWHFKESLADAPCGIPDFDQYQMLGPAYCGPTAGANSFWWLWANPSESDLHIPEGPVDVPTLINEISIAAGTDPYTGTECDSLEAAMLEVIKAHGGWWFFEETYYAPPFWSLSLMFSYDLTSLGYYYSSPGNQVLLLLGFWQQQPDSSWTRFGGHFVTLAGVDIFGPEYQLALSDPAIDNAEASMPGNICHTDSFPHPEEPAVHNNPANASHDYYYVAWPSESPGGNVWLPDYYLNWQDFEGQNFRTEHQSYQASYNPALPVVVEVEQAIQVSPGRKWITLGIESSHAGQADNNYGGFADGWWVYFTETSNYVYSGNYGSYILGTEQADLNCSYGVLYPEHSFTPLPSKRETFIITGAAGDYSISQLTLSFKHSDYDLYITHYVFGFSVPEGGNQDCGQVFEHVFVVENRGATDVFSLWSGVINDVDIGDNACEVGIDPQHQSMWMWDAVDSTHILGMTKKPAFVGDAAITGWGLNNPDRIYDNQYLDSLMLWLQSGIWQVDNRGTFDDKSLLIGNNSFDLPAGGIHIEKWIKWGYYAETGGANAMADGLNHFLYSVLHQEGFYRGDVNKNGMLSVSDVIYLINYLFKGGPEPIEFVDQGDVNCDEQVNVSDVVYIINYLFKGGLAPIDKNRFLENSPFVDEAHKALAERDPGLFGDPDWLNLGQ